MIRDISPFLSQNVTSDEGSGAEDEEESKRHRQDGDMEAGASKRSRQ